MQFSFLRFTSTICLILLIGMLVACRKEAELIADESPHLYTLPQGNQPYDDSIMEIYNKYGSYVLYKFSQKDLTYDYSSNLRAKSANADPDYIDTTLKFLKRQCFDFYPESFLKKTLPFKILLAASLDTLNSSTTYATYARSITGFAVSKNMMAVGWTDSTLLYTTYSKKQLRGWLNGAYIRQALLSGALNVPEGFLKHVPENYLNIGNVERQNGVLYPTGNISIQDRGPIWDFAIYVSVITSASKADLEATIFQPSYDTSGKIRLKYNAVIAYFQNEFGIDLQAIGEAE